MTMKWRNEQRRQRREMNKWETIGKEREREDEKAVIREDVEMMTEECRKVERKLKKKKNKSGKAQVGPFT